MAASPSAAPAAEKTAPTPSKTPAPEAPPFEETYECRESVSFDVTPDTALVTVDGEIIGAAGDWSGGVLGEKYKFKGEGVHYVKLTHRDYKTTWLRFLVSATAGQKTAKVQLELKEAKAKNEDR